MTHFMHAISVGAFAPNLGSLSNVLDKGLQHQVIQRLDANALPDARLAPDMFTLTQQVQLACDHAKNGSARLAGAAPPAFEDNEITLEDLKSRIQRTIDYLGSLDEGAFAGAEARRISLPLQAGLTLECSGLEFLRDWAQPHFYFHVVTAYDILRHAGVEIGKRDYLGHIAYAIRQTA
jgi:hypothetical protein